MTNRWARRRRRRIEIDRLSLPNPTPMAWEKIDKPIKLLFVSDDPNVCSGFPNGKKTAVGLLHKLRVQHWTACRCLLRFDGSRGLRNSQKIRKVCPLRELQSSQHCTGSGSTVATFAPWVRVASQVRSKHLRALSQRALEA